MPLGRTAVRPYHPKPRTRRIEFADETFPGWKPRTPISTKYFIYRHYYEPENVFASNTLHSTNIFRTVGKVDLLQAKRKKDNSLSTPKLVITTDYMYS